VKKVEVIGDKVGVEKNLDLVIAKASLAYNKKELEITNEVSKHNKYVCWVPIFVPFVLK
jgi:Skp family chaperone for outer membrane proteins